LRQSAKHLKPSKSYFDQDLIWPLAGAVLTALYVLIAGCVTRYSGPEPKIHPTIWLPVVDDTGKTILVDDSKNDRMTLEDPRIFDYYCSELKTLEKQKEKNLRCKVWE